MISSTKADSEARLSKAVRQPGADFLPESFDWPLANEAEQFLRRRANAFLEVNTFARRLAERMREETGTDFFEWIDHLVLPSNDEKDLLEAGFVRDRHAETPNGEAVYEHPRATLPRVLLREGQRQNPSYIALRPEFAAD